MKRMLLIAVCLCWMNHVYAQQLPGTEIYLFDLSVKKSSVTITHPQNITNHKGYDNQPYFHPEKPLLYYASSNADDRTDILAYDYIVQKTKNITTTSEREYSPTVTPDGQFLSCIIQRDNGAQDLGKYPIEGGEPTDIINTLTIGYHAWIDHESLLLFVLGDTMKLHRVNLTSRKDEIIAQNIGRSLHRIPQTKAMSFVQKVLEKEWLIRKINEDGSITTIKSTLPGREDLAWTSDGKIIMSDGTHLYFMQPGKIEMWQPVKMPSTLTGIITRLAVNTTGDKLAVVVSE